MITPLEMTGEGSVNWGGHEVADVLGLGLDLDLTSAASFAANAADGVWPGGPGRLKAKGSRLRPFAR